MGCFEFTLEDGDGPRGSNCSTLFESALRDSVLFHSGVRRLESQTACKAVAFGLCRFDSAPHPPVEMT